MTDLFRIVIDGVIRGGVMRRGEPFNHPTMGNVHPGENSTDEFYREKFSAWPFVVEQKPPYNPRKHKAKKQHVIDVDAGIVTRTYSTPDKSLQDIEADKRQEISNRLDRELEKVSAGTNRIRRETWPLMAEQARLFKRKDTAAVRTLRKRAAKAGVDVGVMADRIIAKADPYEDAIADISGQEDLLSAQIDAIIDDVDTSDDEKIDLILLVEWPE